MGSLPRGRILRRDWWNPTLGGAGGGSGWGRAGLATCRRSRSLAPCADATPPSCPPRKNKARMTAIYVDGDACPVREEVYRVASRHRVEVFVVSNGSRPIRPPGMESVHMVVVAEGADMADDWIAERVPPADLCVTADIPLAARCLARGARALSHTGRRWTGDNIGNALAGREVARHLR